MFGSRQSSFSMADLRHGHCDALLILRALVNRLDHCEITTTTQEFEEIGCLMEESKLLWDDDDA